MHGAGSNPTDDEKRSVIMQTAKVGQIKVMPF
jgi:hypothetical protein